MQAISSETQCTADARSSSPLPESATAVWHKVQFFGTIGTLCKAPVRQYFARMSRTASKVLLLKLKESWTKTNAPIPHMVTQLRRESTIKWKGLKEENKHFPFTFLLMD